MTRRTRRLRISRDTILFVAGLVGIGYETLAKGGERPTLLILFAAMVGLPAFLRTDERYSSSPPPRPREVEPEGKEGKSK